MLLICVSLSRLSDMNQPDTLQRAHTKLPRTPSFRLDGRRALVTGAGRGIGLAAAAALAEAGAHVVLVARTAAQIEAAAHEISTIGGSAEPFSSWTLPICRRPAGDRSAAPVRHTGEQCRHQPPAHLPRRDRGGFRRHHRPERRAPRSSSPRRWRGGWWRQEKRGSIIHISSQMGHVGGATAHRLLHAQARRSRG